jgi:hypothetical protein
MPASLSEEQRRRQRKLGKLRNGSQRKSPLRLHVNSL